MPFDIAGDDDSNKKRLPLQFFARSEQLETIRACLQGDNSSSNGCHRKCILVSGPSGVGKSELLTQAVSTTAKETSFLLGSSKFDPHASATNTAATASQQPPLDVLHTCIRQLVEQIISNDTLEQTCLEALQTQMECDHRQLLASILPATSRCGNNAKS